MSQTPEPCPHCEELEPPRLSSHCRTCGLNPAAYREVVEALMLLHKQVQRVGLFPLPSPLAYASTQAERAIAHATGGQA